MEKPTCGHCFTQIRNMSVKKGKNSILKNINWDIHCGELVAVIGVNGAGKSTLLKALLGEVPYQGEIAFQNTNKIGMHPPIMGYVPQKLEFDLSSPVSVLDIFAATQSKRPVWLGVSRKMREQIKESLRRVEAEYLMDRRIGVLSGGELQRVLLALALEPMPNILLLDEPVAGMDANGLKLFYETVSHIREKYDLAIVLVSHDLELVAHYADQMIVIHQGQLIAKGKPKEVFKKPKVEAIFKQSFSKAGGAKG
ncbi:ABC transporter ATP-binding protein [Sporanaerobium hydrogeniformans]|uniref:ABC transporter ATP-binding protein n=1 Tax=Sporanaerobium hydrogeniformans TaxID=3072179 RepID=A0AC61DG58_9FIRM|nr:metal ABC transporter ATP-binding protein [Sporanaerobium hydrogeniformans]PHV71417.1 ABC transporter ATP-binding protein [Sporanaerobium hydrogeniformans]